MRADAAGDRWRSTAGWWLAGCSVALMAAVPIALSIDVASQRSSPGGSGTFLLGGVVVGFAVSGAVLVRRRPGNPLGWLLGVVGLLLALSSSAGEYGTRALSDPDGSLPYGLFATMLGACAFVPALLLPVLVMPAMYPTGRPASHFWRWHIAVSLVGMTAMVLATATVEKVSADAIPGADLPWDAPEWWAWATLGTSAALIIPAVAVVIVGTLFRVARARTPERQQLLWLVSVVGIMIGTLALPASEVPFMVTFACIPLAVLVGVLRYQLLGIETALRRTLLYAPLALTVALVIGGLTSGLALLVPDGPLPLLGASAVVAIVVIPLAGPLRRQVDRLVLGVQDDPLTLVGRVGAGLQTAVDDPVTAMLEAVATAAGASYAAVCDGAGLEVATVGVPCRGSTLDVPLVYDGEALGVLRVGPRHGEQSLTVRDDRLVHALAPHMAVVVNSRRLTEDLAKERQRVTAATLDERDRLRRDLHDGLGPSLSGIALGLEAAGTALQRDPHAAAELLERTRCEADAAVREVRRVLDGLRPAVLDRQTLAGAVREAAEQLGMGTAGRPHLEMMAGTLPPLPSELEESAFRIVAEALTNVTRHSGAGHCRVRIAEVGGHLRVDVVDDGHGLALPRRTGHGLDSMRRRAAEVGGCLTVGSVQPHGTAITAVLPMRQTT